MPNMDRPDADERDTRKTAADHIDAARRELYSALQAHVPPYTTFGEAHYKASQVIKAIKVLDNITPNR